MGKPTALIGIDPAVGHTGIVAVSSDGVVLNSAIAGYSLSDSAGSFDRCRRLSDIRASIMTFAYDLRRFTPLAFALESKNFKTIGYASDNEALIYFVYDAVRQIMDCHWPISIAPTTLKKFATGNAKADKRAVIKHAQFMGLKSGKSDLADAFWLAVLAGVVHGCNLDKIRKRLRPKRLAFAFNDLLRSQVHMVEI